MLSAECMCFFCKLCISALQSYILHFFKWNVAQYVWRFCTVNSFVSKIVRFFFQFEQSYCRHWSFRHHSRRPCGFTTTVELATAQQSIEWHHSPNVELSCVDASELWFQSTYWHYPALFGFKFGQNHLIVCFFELFFVFWIFFVFLDIWIPINSVEPFHHRLGCWPICVVCKRFFFFFFVVIIVFCRGLSDNRLTGVIPPELVQPFSVLYVCFLTASCIFYVFV